MQWPATDRSNATNPSVSNGDGAFGNLCLCVDCGGDISLLSPKALRCRDCAYEKDKERARNYYEKNKIQVLRRVKAYQQTPGHKQKREEWRERNPERLLVYRDRKRQSHRAKTGYNPEGRKCQKCHVVDISARGHRAKYCHDCAKPLTRTCEVCRKDITRQKGRKLPYCRDCRQEFWRLKEEQGYTKVCTKCKEEKPHPDFGFHSGRRRSACKRCEADATQDYYQALPVEERRERRRIQGQREREKTASLPPEQREPLKIKMRKDANRRKYGPNFDADRLHLKQGRKCAICRKSAPLGKLEVDHDHKTHVKGTMHSVRGLLCKNCNLKLVARYEKFPPERQDWPYMNQYLARGKCNDPSELGVVP